MWTKTENDNSNEKMVDYLSKLIHAENESIYSALLIIGGASKEMRDNLMKSFNLVYENLELNRKEDSK